MEGQLDTITKNAVSEDAKVSKKVEQRLKGVH